MTSVSTTTIVPAPTPLFSPDENAHPQSRDQQSVSLLARAAAAPPALQASLREQVVTLNMELASNLARRYHRRGISEEDLRQVAFLGLLKAVRGFRPERSDSFTGYAIPTIRGELRRHFRDSGWTVRPPRRIQELQARVRSVEADLVHELHRTPTVQELAEAVGAAVEDVTESAAATSCFSPLSLDAPTSEDGPDLGSTLVAGEADLANAEARLLLGPAVRRLGERDRLVLDLRFFEGLTQQEIGERLGVSQMQVSRILARILSTLREEIGGLAA